MEQSPCGRGIWFLIVLTEPFCIMFIKMNIFAKFVYYNRHYGKQKYRCFTPVGKAPRPIG